MPSLGLPELVVIGMILMLVFGASRLPSLGESLGRSVRTLKRSFSHEARIDVAQAGEPQGTRTEDPASEVSDAELLDKDPAPDNS